MLMVQGVDVNSFLELLDRNLTDAHGARCVKHGRNMNIYCETEDIFTEARFFVEVGYRHVYQTNVSVLRILDLSDENVEEFKTLKCGWCCAPFHTLSVLSNHFFINCFGEAVKLWKVVAIRKSSVDFFSSVLQQAMSSSGLKRTVKKISRSQACTFITFYTAFGPQYFASEKNRGFIRFMTDRELVNTFGTAKVKFFPQTPRGHKRVECLMGPEKGITFELFQNASGWKVRVKFFPRLSFKTARGVQ